MICKQGAPFVIFTIILAFSNVRSVLHGSYCLISHGRVLLFQKVSSAPSFHGTNFHTVPKHLIITWDKHECNLTAPQSQLTGITFGHQKTLMSLTVLLLCKTSNRNKVLRACVKFPAVLTQTSSILVDICMSKRQSGTNRKWPFQHL